MARILFSLQWFIYAETHVTLKITHNFKPESKHISIFHFLFFPQNKIRMRKPSKESCISSLTLLYGKETFPWYVWNKNSDTKYFLWKHLFNCYKWLYFKIWIKTYINLYLSYNDVSTNLYIPDINYKHIVDDPLSRS